MDGVLVDSYQAHFKSWRRMAAEHGIAMTEAQFATTFGRTSRDIIAHFWGVDSRGAPRLSDAEIAAMDQRKERIYRDMISVDFPAMDGARELLADLHRAGFALAIGSSGPSENVEAALTGLGQAQLFGATVNGMEVTRGKPDPQVFLLAAGKLAVPPANCAVVEDAPAGLRAARAAGMAAIALTGTASRDVLTPLADCVVDSLRELGPELIARLIAGNPTRSPASA
jgi:beta-phosphoglucomutase